MQSSVDGQVHTPIWDVMLAKLDELREQLNAPSVPLEKQLWDKKAAAAYLGLAPLQFSNRVMSKASFPRPVSVSGGAGLNSSGWRWKATDVINWAMAQKVGK